MNSKSRQQRRRRIRARVFGTFERPRVSVHRSANNITLQLIDDAAGKTLACVSSLQVKGNSKVDKAEAVGEAMAKAAIGAGVKSAVFDRSGYLYHGRIKAVADGLRKGGLQV